MFINHSGGCPGADMTWEREGEKYGVHTIAYSFYNHVQEGKNQKILNGLELKEGFEHVMIASKTLKRNPSGQYDYVKHLLARNWFQVKNSEAIFAIGKFQSYKIVSGGTGWAVQMAIDNEKPVFVFNQSNKSWNKFNYEHLIFDMLDYIPTLTENFAGIGTRDITQDGIKAIQEVYKKNFSV